MLNLKTNRPRFIIAAVAIPFNERGEVLLSQRNAPNRLEVHAKWQMAGGGVEYGETPEETLHRELREELGAECEVLFPFPLIHVNTWPAQPNTTERDTHVTLMSYIVKISPHHPIEVLDEETLAAKWYSLAEVRELDTLPGTKELVEQAWAVVKKYQLL